MLAMRVLFLSPHTDDVELGAGGTLTHLREQGHEVYWLVFSTAESSLPPDVPRDTLKKEFLEVAGNMGLGDDHYRIFDFMVRYLPDHRQQILEELVKAKREFSPDLVIGPSLNDHHQDHEVVAKEMVRAFKNSSSIISYELPWNHTEFDNQLFIKLARRQIDRKVELLSCYRSQVRLERPYFSSDFIHGWARMRGGQVGAEYAEAFEVIRWIM
jgi:LmbE family N-acetylglucosaminyl deacetylase